jgi:protein SCO1
MSAATYVNDRPNTTTGYRIARLWYIVLLLPLVGLLGFAILQPILVLPRIGLGPGFAFLDQNGRRLTNEDLRGRIVLYNFTYTGCVQPCPQTSATMQAVQTMLPLLQTRGIGVDLVTISFDPEQDTAAQLRAFGQDWQADFDRWHFVTGDPTVLKYVIGGGFGVYYQAKPAQQEVRAFTFDPTFVLVDGAGIVRAKYRTATPELAILQRDIELVAEEAAQSTGAARLAYEAAHLFVCYPK